MTFDIKEARTLIPRLEPKNLKIDGIWFNIEETLTAALDEIATLRTEKHADAEAIGALREALLDATAHLAGASSAYKTFAARHPKWGTPTPDALFGTRFKDFDAAVERARAALEGSDQ